jgi:hypothetical protein
LQAVEERLKSIQETPPGLQQRSPGQRDTETPSLSEQHPYDFQPTDTTSSLVGNGPQDRQIISPGIEEDVVDGMGAIVLTDDEEEIGFFGQFPLHTFVVYSQSNFSLAGASSNIALFKRITQAVAQALSSTAPSLNNFRTTHQLIHPSTGIPSPAVSKRDGKRNEDCRVNLYKVPAFSEGVALIRQFFATVGMMLPCFYEEHFLESYKQAVQNEFSGVRRPWLAILNTMFAFSTTTSSTSSPTQKTADESDKYYQRALGLATQDMLSNSSLETGMTQTTSYIFNI